MSDVPNIVNVARREFLSRIRTRTFIFATLFLVLGVVAIALVPVIISAIDRGEEPTVAVWVADDVDLAADPVLTLDALLNAPTGAEDPVASAGGGFEVLAVGDVDAARVGVDDGDYSAVLAIERAADDELAFTLYTNAAATGRMAQLVRQASTAIAVADRLDRLGLEPTDQAALFAPAEYSVAWADPGRTDPTTDEVTQGTDYLLGYGLTILIFMMIILYGNWVAMSVVEEKSSRVMEVILNAATPFQLLTGKVLGVGSVAGVQYVAMLAAGLAALLLQGTIADLLLGGGASSIDLPEGLTPGLLVVLVVYGVLGFLLYAVLYAAAGSLVSRQEDVNQVVTPMSMISVAGYLIALYTGTGLLEIDSNLLVVLSMVPFLSPFLMVSRAGSGDVAIWEYALSISLLVIAIAVALWIAARIYAAGVLLYGQRPSVRTIWRLARKGM
jgi:ABC-2 type transport system permease protein